MNLIIPMAGKGTRLRPQTLTTPKPLIEIAGKTIVQRIVDILSKMGSSQIQSIGFIIEQKSFEIEKMLHCIGRDNNINVHIFYQEKALGTAHAIYCAKKILFGPTLIVFADTLFESEIKIPNDSDGCVFVKEVDDPRAYGVVRLNKKGEIVEFIEKPTNKISNLAIVGIYYFKDGVILSEEIKNILDKKIMIKGEYQITTVLENLKNKNLVFTPHKIKKWFDFGTPKNLLESHKEILKNTTKVSKSFKNTTIIPPCYIAEGVQITDSEIGPNTSIGAGTIIQSSKIKNSIVQSNSSIKGGVFDMSIIGNYVDYNSNFKTVNIGDYTTLK